MHEKEYVALVEKLEVFARENPTAYRWRVGLLAALGYSFLYAIVAAVLLLVVGVVYVGLINFIVIKILIIPIGMAAVVLRSLWIEFPEPEGLELKYNDAPKLFALADKIRKVTNGPRVHKFLLTNDYNAGVIQRPRLGWFGWHQNYLVVGLPLLQALSTADLRAVLAHEFGHLSGDHGQFTSWIYRVRQTWVQVLIRMQEHRRFGSRFFETFFNWYARYFGAYSFVMARAQEYEADRCSVIVTGKQIAARAMINLELKQKALNENFWPSLFRRADQQADPPGDTFTEMLRSLREPITTDKAQIWFAQSLTRRHEYDDTHPALADRLEAIGYTQVRESLDVSVFEANKVEQNSAEYFLSLETTEFVASQNRMWKEGVSVGWQQRHQFVNEARVKLVELEEKIKLGPLSAEDQWERARLTASTESYAAAVPLLRDVLETVPDHAAANYTLGEALLEAGDESGIKHIETAIEKDPTAIPSGCELIYMFLTIRERKDEAMRYRQATLDYYEEVDLANAERQNISKKDAFIAHSLSFEVVAGLRAQLAKYPKLGTAYLVRKVVKHFPEQPSYVLGVISKTPWYRSQSNKRDQQLINELASQVTLPDHTYVIALEHNYKPLRKVLRGIKDSEIYRA